MVKCNFLLSQSVLIMESDMYSGRVIYCVCYDFHFGRNLLYGYTFFKLEYFSLAAWDALQY